MTYAKLWQNIPIYLDKECYQAWHDSICLDKEYCRDWQDLKMPR